MAHRREGYSLASYALPNLANFGIAIGMAMCISEYQMNCSKGPKPGRLKTRMQKCKQFANGAFRSGL